MNEIPETLAANADAVIDAAPEGTATPTDTASTAETIIPETPPIEPQETETQAFARRLREKVEAERTALSQEYNSEIADLGMEWNGQPITTIEQLRQAKAEQKLQEEAAKQNVPVEVLSRLTQAERDALEAKNMLSEYQRKEAMNAEATALAADPVWGDFYKSHEADIKAVAEQAKVDLDTAKLIVLNKVGMPKVDEAAIRNKAIQEYIEGKVKDYKPVEGSGATPTQVVSTPKTFAEARQGSMALLRSMREQT